MEEFILRILMGLHIAAGFTALVVAPIAMAVRKGGNAHRLWGKVFFYAMALVGITAVVVGIARANILMAMVAIFSFHMIASGYRALYLKRLHEGQRPERIDYIIQGTAAVINGGLFLWGLINMALGHRNSGSIIFFTFGTIGLLMVFLNMQRFYKRSHDKREWLYAHMTGFLGGYIATVSAFSAVNLPMIKPMWLQWLWPTLLGAPLIALWTRYYRGKFTRGRRTRDLLDVRIR
ncbi:MAG: hypothetical protein ABI432_06235 [Flavobacteriales bacterium]